MSWGEDFTHGYYRNMLLSLRQIYAFLPLRQAAFPDALPARCIFLRHDVDVSLESGPVHGPH